MQDNEILALFKEALLYAAPNSKAAAEEMTLDAPLSNLGIESVTALEMAGYIEEKLDVQFPDDELSSINNMRGFADMVRRHAAK